MSDPLPTSAPKLMSPRRSRWFGVTGAAKEIASVVGTEMADVRDKVEATIAARAGRWSMVER